MELHKSERCHSANDELRDFLRQAEDLANETGMIREGDVSALSMRLSNCVPEVGDASRGETLDSGLRIEIAEYVKNLRALQSTLEKVHSVILIRKLQMEAAKRRLDKLPAWTNARNPIT